MHFGSSTPRRVAIFATAPCVIGLALVQLYFTQTEKPPQAQDLLPILFSSDNPNLVYSNNPDDSWNRVFHSLFSRTIRTRLSDNFPEGAPFAPLTNGMSRIKVSDRTFERFENGDRSIDPLYPSFFSNNGARKVLTEPEYSTLARALRDALDEKPSRPILARALMQSDVWGAYDLLFARREFPGTDQAKLHVRREDLLSLLRRFIRKLALTPRELSLLPDNNAASSVGYGLSNAFAPNGEWLEVQLSPNRLHDFAADFRRSTRVFLRPAQKPVDKKLLLAMLEAGNVFSPVDSFALITQNLLVDTDGNVVPSPITTEVQVRRFVRDRGTKTVVEIHQYELSRRALLSASARGGLVEMDNNADFYLSASGNDYQFASPQFTTRGNDYPVLVSLRQRCEGCHGPGATAIFTLSSHDPPLAPITFMNASDNVHGWYVAGRKQEREDFKSIWQRK